MAMTMTDEEALLVNTIVHILQDDRVVNPFGGSVPVEKVQNVLVARHTSLFRRVVGGKRGAWLAFLARHRTTFVVFVDVYRKLRRVRLLWQAGWRMADEQEEFHRIGHEQYLVAALVHFLVMQPEGRQRTVDAFMHAYPELSFAHATLAPLPRRGDLVRVIRKHHHLVRFDRDTFELSLP